MPSSQAASPASWTASGTPASGTGASTPKKEATLWLESERLTLEYRGQPLSRYDVQLAEGTEELRTVTRPRLFETSFVLPQPRLFGLDDLGDRGWIKALELGGYAARRSPGAGPLQQALFAYETAL